MSTLNRFKQYMGKRKVLMPLSLTLSALSALIGLVPYFLIWVIIRKYFFQDILPGMSVTQCAWWAVGAAILCVIVYYAALILSHLTAFRVESNMRRDAMEKVIHMPMGFFNNTTMGRVRKVIDDNASITHTFLAHQMPDISASITLPIAVILSIFIFNWQLGLACLVPILLAMFCMSFMMTASGVSWMKMYMDALEDMNTEAIEYVRGIPVVKVFQQTIYSFKSFYASIQRYNDTVQRCTNTWRLPMSGYTMAINSFAFVLVPAVILLMGNKGDMVKVLTDFFFFILVTPFLTDSIMRNSYLSSSKEQAKQVLDRMDHLLSFEPLKESGHPQKPDSHDIKFCQVTFAYPGMEKKAVEKVSFAIPEGKRFALVGESGGGKSTIARLVPRFWDPQEGEVLIGGINVKEIAQADLMEEVAIVFQNVKLFKTTLLDNIRMGRPTASMEEIDAAVNAAQCREIIDRLPQGLETKIGTEGTYLSDGEQQRIVLARAILKDAPIVVLDEATAFADPENEHLIQKALKELTKGKTLLMIAHRLSSVVDADQILLVEEGHIAERGTHEELVASGGHYASMWKKYNKSITWTLKDSSVKEEVCHD